MRWYKMLRALLHCNNIGRVRGIPLWLLAGCQATVPRHHTCFTSTSLGQRQLIFMSPTLQVGQYTQFLPPCHTECKQLHCLHPVVGPAVLEWGPHPGAHTMQIRQLHATSYKYRSPARAAAAAVILVHSVSRVGMPPAKPAPGLEYWWGRTRLSNSTPMLAPFSSTLYCRDTARGSRPAAQHPAQHVAHNLLFLLMHVSTRLAMHGRLQAAPACSCW